MRPGVIVLLLASCATQAGPDPSSTVPEPAATAPPAATASACREGRFVAEGRIGLLGESAGDARRVSALRWSGGPGCERFVVELVTADGAPATRSGAVEAEVLRGLGLVRLRLPPEVDETAVADAAFEGELASRAFVVRDDSGSLHVDLHLGAPARALAFGLSSPARLVVDLRRGGGALPPGPAVSDFVVLVEPRPGPVAYPLTVHGYARTFEATVVARLRQDGRLVSETVTTAADHLQTWGEFSLTIEDGPPGTAELFVGEDSPRDGSEQGVRIELVP